MPVAVIPWPLLLLLRVLLLRTNVSDVEDDGDKGGVVGNALFNSALDAAAVCVGAATTGRFSSISSFSTQGMDGNGKVDMRSPLTGASSESFTDLASCVGGNNELLSLVQPRDSVFDMGGKWDVGSSSCRFFR